MNNISILVLLISAVVVILLSCAITYFICKIGKHKTKPIAKPVVLGVFLALLLVLGTLSYNIVFSFLLANPL